MQGQMFVVSDADRPSRVKPVDYWRGQLEQYRRQLRERGIDVAVVAVNEGAPLQGDVDGLVVVRDGTLAVWALMFVEKEL